MLKLRNTCMLILMEWRVADGVIPNPILNNLIYQPTASLKKVNLCCGQHTYLYIYVYDSVMH